MEGQNALFNEDGSDEGEAHEDGSDSDEMDSDVEVILNGKHQAPEEDEEDEDGDEDESEDGEEDDEDVEGMDEEAALKLDADLAALLHVNMPDASAMDIDSG